MFRAIPLWTSPNTATHPARREPAQRWAYRKRERYMHHTETRVCGFPIVKHACQLKLPFCANVKNKFFAGDPSISYTSSDTLWFLTKPRCAAIHNLPTRGSGLSIKSTKVPYEHEHTASELRTSMHRQNHMRSCKLTHGFNCSCAGYTI